MNLTLRIRRSPYDLDFEVNRFSCYLVDNNLGHIEYMSILSYREKGYDSKRGVIEFCPFYTKYKYSTGLNRYEEVNIKKIPDPGKRLLTLFMVEAVLQNKEIESLKI